MQDFPRLGTFRSQLGQDRPDGGSHAHGGAPPFLVVETLHATLDLGDDVAGHAHGTVGGAVGHQRLDAGDVTHQPDQFIQILAQVGALALFQGTEFLVHQGVGFVQPLGGHGGQTFLGDACVLGAGDVAGTDFTVVTQFFLESLLLHADGGGGEGQHAQFFGPGADFGERHEQRSLSFAGHAAHADIVVGEQVRGHFGFAEGDQDVPGAFPDHGTTGERYNHPPRQHKTRGTDDLIE